MEGALPRINALLSWCEQFQKELGSDSYVDLYVPPEGSNVPYNGGILAMDYNLTEGMQDACDEVEAATDEVADVLLNALADCRGLVDGADGLMEQVSAASRKLHRVKNLKTAVTLYGMGIKNLERDLQAGWRSAMAETEARDKEITVADTEETFAEKYISRENGIGSLSDEEVIECFEAIPAYDFFSRCRSKHKSEEYAYKQELAPRYYQIMREEGGRIGEEYGVLEDLPYIYGELPDIDKGPELDEWNRRQVAAYEHYELVKSMGVDLAWTEEYYQYAKGRAGLEDLKKETRDNWVSNSEDSVIYKAAGAVPGSVYSFVCYVAGKPIDADSAWYYPSQMTQTIRGTVEDGMGNGFTGEVKKIVYRSGMGMADFAAAQVFTNGRGEILLGMEGYADTAMTGAGRGLSPFAIQGEAAIAGFGDMLMGKVFKKAGSETLTKGMVHAVETGTISSLMNTGADCILAGDKSSIKEEYQGCLDAGMSNGEAIVRVGVLEGGKLLENVAQGVISTAGFHGIGKVTTTLGTHMGIIDGPSHVDTDGLREPEADVE